MDGDGHIWFDPLFFHHHNFAMSTHAPNSLSANFVASTPAMTPGNTVSMRTPARWAVMVLIWTVKIPIVLRRWPSLVHIRQHQSKRSKYYVSTLQQNNKKLFG